MFPVSYDFAAIAKRLKEIQDEEAKERSAAEARREAGDGSPPEPHKVYDDMSACA